MTKPEFTEAEKDTMLFVYDRVVAFMTELKPAQRKWVIRALKSWDKLRDAGGV